MADDPKIRSKRIAVLRRLLPALAALGFVALIVGANDDWRQSFSRNAEELLIGGLSIDAPVFAGRLSDGRAYRLQAETGRQTDDGGIALIKPELDIGGTQTLTADAGTADKSRSRMQLAGNVRVSDAGGNLLATEQMFFAAEDGRLQAPQRIVMTGPAGRLQAAKLEADTKAGTYRFDTVTLRLERGGE